VSIAQKVKAVKFVYWSGGKVLRDIWFTLADNSTAKTCNCSSSSCNAAITLPLSATQSLVGLATKSFSISNKLDARNDLSIWVENVEQCSGCTRPPTLGFASTIANKTYSVTSPAVTTEVLRTNLGEPCFGISTFTFAYEKNGIALS